jgi:uncharacterized membrane protein
MASYYVLMALCPTKQITMSLVAYNEEGNRKSTTSVMIIVYYFLLLSFYFNDEDSIECKT